jgi:AbrB family looped-hinge helix DNA binding protein
MASAVLQTFAFAEDALSVARMTELASIHPLTYRDSFDNIGRRFEMETVKVSPKFQVVIPKKIRDSLELKPGEELQIYILDRSIRLHRPRLIKELRGIAKGMQWKEEDRDRNDRF